ncbi:SRPBCC family protein [Kineococcus rubinsiae]|uniref:SRPBCC family protein n=1 Tax=Kineococcus rubinsiae TaxID=2609562 RepID=UPI001430EA29|nr:SRPBCC family protein [Kineococcus rubinsiae]NIZ93053.1 SRPBCC family protein [Kineococcus rubinsiae]
MRRRLAVRGPRGAGPVWADYAEPARWSRWSPQVRGVTATGPELRAGLAGTVRGPLGLRVPFDVTAADCDARTWAWEVRCAGVGLRLEHGVRGVGDGCLTWLVLDGPAAVVLAYSPVARLALRRLVGA